MSEDIVGEIKDIKGRTWQEAFYLQTKAFLEKNSEHIKEIERLKAEVERLNKAGDALADKVNYYYVKMGAWGNHPIVQAWKAAKEGKQ
jgi:hypothetical protein